LSSFKPVEGMHITPEQLAHLSPMDWEHINLTGDYVWDLTVKSPTLARLNVQFSRLLLRLSGLAYTFQVLNSCLIDEI